MSFVLTNNNNNNNNNNHNNDNLPRVKVGIPSSLLIFKIMSASLFFPLGKMWSLTNFILVGQCCENVIPLAGAARVVILVCVVHAHT